MSQPLRVLIVDDSALVRQTLESILSESGGFVVETARDGVDALEKMRRSRPDVMLLDLQMPRMNGMTLLRRVMETDPLPVVVCSQLDGIDAQEALQAIQAGAVDIIVKSQLGVRDFLYESAVTLIDAVRAAAGARVTRRPAGPRPVNGLEAAPAAAPAAPASVGRVVVMGASTGGTEALQHVLGAMPPDAPPLVVVQHMPPKFTLAFANYLAQRCRIEVKEAADGDVVRPGRALIAPGDFHIQLRRRGGGLHVDVVNGPLVSRHRPSVDVLFRSAAEVLGPDAIGVIMTGMGGDGSEGMLAMKQAGAFNIAQDEATSVVFGMPREAISIGAVDTVVPLQRIPGVVLKTACERPRGR